MRAPITLKIEASDGLPGFNHTDLLSYLALHMRDARLADWHFEPMTERSSAPNRVEWSFKANPSAEPSSGVHHRITIEARLYMNGEYETLVEQQATIQGGPNDPELAAAVAGIIVSLLGPSGAYRAVNPRQGVGH
jgi:hypothetical protein